MEIEHNLSGASPANIANSPPDAIASGWHDVIANTNWIPFDHRVSPVQTLSFTYAQRVFATAKFEWSTQCVEQFHIVTPNGEYTNIGLLLCDQCPYLIKCGVFEGESKTTLLEQHEFTGSLLSQIDHALAFLQNHDPNHVWPFPALRESLINAALHRDYTYSGPILVNLFDSRIETVSLGGLVQGLGVNDLLNGVSQARNTWLADVFNALGLCENYGTGMQRIMESYERCAHSPQLRVGPSSIALILPKPASEDSLGPSDGRLKDSAASDADMQPDAASDITQGHAKVFAFPAANPRATDTPALALKGMRVVGCAPLPTLLLGAGAYNAPAADPEGANGHALRAMKTYPLNTLEEMTLHLLAERGVPLSRAEVEQSLGLNKNRTAHLLRSLAEQGKISKRGRSRATRYSLA